MTSPEYTEYERVTEGMEFKFSALSDKEYKNANIKYWRDMVASDEVLRGNRDFRKYLFY